MKALVLGAMCLASVAACTTPASREALQAPEPSAAPGAKGAVTVAGLPASEALGAVDTKKLVGSAPQNVAANQPAATGEAGAPGAASNTIAVEGVAPAAVLAAIDPTKLIDARPDPSPNGAPKAVAGVIASGKTYTTQDLAKAQLEAVRNEKSPR